MTAETLIHPIPPLFDARSRVLLLGSFPSPKSREAGFFYGHPQNRFWRVLAAVLEKPVPVTIADKRALCLENGVALWDVLAACQITGASDTSIRNPVPNDFTGILRTARLGAVFTTGATAHRLYEKLCAPVTGLHAGKLPSTSPANAAWTLERLTQAYRALLPHLATVGGETE